MSEEILPGFTCEFVHEGDTCKLIDFLVDENRKLRNEVDNLMDFEHLTSVAVAYAGCDECGEYKQTMLRLFAENAKLRELVATYEGTPQEDVIDCLRQECIDWEDRYRTLAAENAKLRKLFLDVWNDACEFDGFWDYMMDDGEIYNEDELPYYQERMRELGIEVD